MNKGTESFLEKSEEPGVGGGRLLAGKTEESKNTQLKLAYLHFLIYYESSKKYVCA